MKVLATAVTAAAALWALSPGPAQSMPIGNLGQAARDGSSLVQNVGYVCGRYRCWWRPGYGYGPDNVVNVCPIATAGSATGPAPLSARLGHMDGATAGGGSRPSHRPRIERR